MRRVDVLLAQQRFRGPVEDEHRLAVRVVSHADIAQPQTAHEAGAERLRGRLLRGEAAREEMRGPEAAAEIFELGGREHPRGETLAETVEAALHALDPHDIRADAVDHRPRASRIRRFISRTAASRPLNTARAMMA